MTLRIILILQLLFFLGNILISQDKIYFKSGQLENGIVKEIGKSEIKFINANNIEGPLYTVKKSKLDSIVYSSGLKDVFSYKPVPFDFNRNIISFHIFDLVLYRDFVFSYEYIFKSGLYGLRIPVAFGYSEYGEGSRDYLNKFYSGIGLNVYPTGQHVVSYFLGPEIDVGIGDENTNYSYSSDEAEQFIYWRLTVNNGININPSPRFNVSTMLGLGIRYAELDDQYESGLETTAYFTISLGYRF